MYFVFVLICLAIFPLFFFLKCIITWYPKKWAKGEKVYTIDEVVQKAQTGDLILFQGNTIIRFTSPVSTWSHVGVVLKPEFGEPAISEAYKTTIDYDIASQSEHSGVQTVDLRKRLATYESGRMAWRPVKSKNPQKAYNKAFQMLLSYHKMPKYNMNLLDLIEYQLGTDNDKNLDGKGNKMFVCTSWVTHVYQSMGWLPKNIYDGTLTLAHYGNKNLRLPFLSPEVTSWGQLHYIEKQI